MMQFHRGIDGLVSLWERFNSVMDIVESVIGESFQTLEELVVPSNRKHSLKHTVSSYRSKAHPKYTVVPCRSSSQLKQTAPSCGSKSQLKYSTPSCRSKSQLGGLHLGSHFVV